MNTSMITIEDIYDYKRVSQLDCLLLYFNLCIIVNASLHRLAFVIIEIFIKNKINNFRFEFEQCINSNMVVFMCVCHRLLK